MDGGGEHAARLDSELPRINTSDSVREKTGRLRYSEQRERLATRVAERKEKARLVGAKDTQKPHGDTAVQTAELPNLAQVKFAADLEAQWQREATKDATPAAGTGETPDENVVVSRLLKLDTGSGGSGNGVVVSKNGSRGDCQVNKDGLNIDTEVEHDRGRDKGGRGVKTGENDDKVSRNPRKVETKIHRKRENVGDAGLRRENNARGSHGSKRVGKDKTIGRNRDFDMKGGRKVRSDMRSAERDRRVSGLKSDARVSSGQSKSQDDLAGVKDGVRVSRSESDEGLEGGSEVVAETEEERLKREEEERVKLEEEERKKKKVPTATLR